MHYYNDYINVMTMVAEQQAFYQDRFYNDWPPIKSTCIYVILYNLLRVNKVLHLMCQSGNCK